MRQAFRDVGFALLIVLPRMFVPDPVEQSAPSASEASASVLAASDVDRISGLPTPPAAG